MSDLRYHDTARLPTWKERGYSEDGRFSPPPRGKRTEAHADEFADRRRSCVVESRVRKRARCYCCGYLRQTSRVVRDENTGQPICVECVVSGFRGEVGGRYMDIYGWRSPDGDWQEAISKPKDVQR